ncbi:protein kinase, partial [uncultured Brachyspira sp.]|uniref:protein kinase domain-containing protein n=1 Tax=uncultured Brachyspira sp. TaxID=221953 RepID=UPI00262BC701
MLIINISTNFTIINIFIIKDFYTSDGTKNQNREINNYESISYPLISQYFGTIDKNEKRSIVIEYINSKSLDHYKNLDLESRFSIFLSVLISIQALHLNGFVYRDLKPENIILDENDYPKVTDFGFSSTFEKSMILFVGTP